MWPRSQGPSPKTPGPGIWFDLEEEAAGICQPTACPQPQRYSWRCGPGNWAPLLTGAAGRLADVHQVGRLRTLNLTAPPSWRVEERHTGEPGHSQKPRAVHPHRAPHGSPWRRGPLSPPQLRCCDTEVLMAGESALPNRELPALLQGSSFIWTMACLRAGVPGGSDGKESACSEETQVQYLGQEGPLEKGMATRSSILAWRIPWIEEPSGPQSMESQRVRCD